MPFRCDVIIVQIIATEVDERGRPIGEKIAQPAKIFRAKSPDFWPEIDRALARMTAPPADAKPAPGAPAPRRGRKG